MQIEDIQKCLKSHREDLLNFFFSKRNYHKYLSKQKVFIFLKVTLQNHVSQD